MFLLKPETEASFSLHKQQNIFVITPNPFVYEQMIASNHILIDGDYVHNDIPIHLDSSNTV